jgi:hypothetical protein
MTSASIAYSNSNDVEHGMSVPISSNVFILDIKKSIEAQTNKDKIIGDYKLKIDLTFVKKSNNSEKIINKAIQLISGHQYGSLDNKKVDKLLKLDTKDQSNIKQNLINQALPKANEAIDETGTVPESKADEGQDDGVVAAQGNIEPLMFPLDTNKENDD